MQPFKPIFSAETNAVLALEQTLSAANQVLALPPAAPGLQVEIIVSSSALIRWGTSNAVSAVAGNRSSCLAYETPTVVVHTIPEGVTHVAVTGTGTIRFHLGSGA